MHGLAPPYLSDYCQLATDVCRATDIVTQWRQEFLCSRTAAMEQPTDRDPEERHYLWTL